MFNNDDYDYDRMGLNGQDKTEGIGISLHVSNFQLSMVGGTNP